MNKIVDSTTCLIDQVTDKLHKDVTSILRLRMFMKVNEVFEERLDPFVMCEETGFLQKSYIKKNLHYVE